MPGNRITIDLPNLTGAAGGTFSVNVPVGRTIHAIGLNFSGTTPPLVGQTIRLRVNGEEVWNVKSETVDMLNVYDGGVSCSSGGTTIDRALMLWFDRLMMLGGDGAELTALGTGDATDPRPIKTILLEVDCTANVSCNAGFVIQSGPSKSGLIRKLKSYTRPVAGAGVLQVVDLPKQGLLNRLVCKAAGNYVDSLRLVVDNYEIYKRTASQDYMVKKNLQYRAPSGNSNIHIYDTTEDGRGSNALPLDPIQDWRVEATMNAADATFKIILDTMDPLRA